MLLVQQMLAFVFAHVAKAASFLWNFHRARMHACARDPSAVSGSRLGWRLISISGVNLYKY